MKVLICDIGHLGEEFVERCREVLPEWRREQMDRYKHELGKVQCAVGWLLVWSCMIQEDGWNEKWTYNNYGKPYFDGRDDMFFSISHCRDAVAAVVAEEEVGIDIEEIGRYRESLVRYTLSDEEIDGINGIKGVDKEEFMRLWTRKEAAFKFYGTGITHEIKDILKREDVEIYSTKVGDSMWLSVAMGKKHGVRSLELEVEKVSVDEIYEILEKRRKTVKK